MMATDVFIREDLQPHLPKENIFAFIAGMEGEEFRALESRRTIAVDLDGKRYFVKYHRGTATAEILKNLLQLRLPVVSARNEWLALSRLDVLGINVPQIAAYGKRGLLPQTCESFIVTDDVGTQENLEDLTRDWQSKPPAFARKLALIREVAAISRRMHSSGICHRDYYICHFMVTGNIEEDSGKGGSLTLIDLHRALLKRKLGQRWIIKDIGSLYFSAMDIGLTSRDLFRFIRLYSGMSLKNALTRESDFWKLVFERATKLKSRHS
jgi:heptose I phosphotransferase